MEAAVFSLLFLFAPIAVYFLDHLLIQHSYSVFVEGLEKFDLRRSMKMMQTLHLHHGLHYLYCYSVDYGSP
jgi:hypothetical protein